MLKKKKPPTPITPPVDDAGGYSSEEEPTRRPKPSSFEDLLKEMSQEFGQRKEPVFNPVETIEPIEEVKSDRSEPAEPTREQKYVAKKQKEAAELAKTQELFRLADEENKHEPHPVLELLREEGGAANAVVLSEILNRRY